MSSTVRCKFRVDELRRQFMPRWNVETGKWTEAECHNIIMVPVHDPAFHAATPHGKIELTVVHSHVGRLFQLGHDYEIDIHVPGIAPTLPNAPPPSSLPAKVA